MKRRVDVAEGLRGEVTLARPMLRYEKNPVLRCHDVNRAWNDPGLQVVTVHNAGVARHGQDTVMLFRSHLRCGLSVIGAARSHSGVEEWEVTPHPVLLPATDDDAFGEGVERRVVIENEAGGVEDPRVMGMEGDPVEAGGPPTDGETGRTFAVTYSAYHGQEPNHVRVHLATTRDFERFVRHGAMMTRDMRNVVLFGSPVQGRYAGLFRPNDATEGDVGGRYTEVRLGFATSWRDGPWDVQETPLMRTGHGPSAFQSKIGPGAPPVRVEAGWLNLFHGVRRTMDGNPYVLGIALHDAADVSRVRVSAIPVLFPSEADCRVEVDDYVHVPNVVFSCGMTRREDGVLLVYYGGNDTVMNVGATHEDILVELCTRYGMDPLSGALLYDLRTSRPQPE